MRLKNILCGLWIYCLFNFVFPVSIVFSAQITEMDLLEIRFAVLRDVSGETASELSGRRILFRTSESDWAKHGVKYKEIMPDIKRINKFRASTLEGVVDLDEATPIPAVILEVNIIGVVLGRAEVLVGLQSSLVSKDGAGDYFLHYDLRRGTTGSWFVSRRNKISLDSYLTTSSKSAFFESRPEEK